MAFKRGVKMKINTNLSSLIVQSSLKTSTNGLNQAIERMTTGFKINHAKDNAANYSISTKLSSKISGYQIAEDNALMGLDMVQTASSSLETMSNLTSRLRSLATQAQNGTYGYKSIDAINSEARSIVQDLNRIKQTTEYNGINLLSSSGESVASSGQFIEEIIRRDTSGMTTLASVDETTSLTSGTYSISTADELSKLAAMTNNGLIGENTEFVLANDIDLSAYSTGEGWTPIGIYDVINGSTTYFRATFDGNGFVISNLYINRLNDYDQGLFGRVDGAEIKNIGLENVDVTGMDYVGGLIGLSDGLTITNSCVTGSISGEFSQVGGLVGYNGNAEITILNSCVTGRVTGDEFVGGLIGSAYAGVSITNSYTTGSVSGNGRYVAGLVGEHYGIDKLTITNSYAAGSMKGYCYVGGLVGGSSELTITNSYATGSVTGNDFCIGGLVGQGYGSITNSYATGSVTGNSDVGGLMGYSDGVVLDNAYYTDTTGQTNGIGAGILDSGTAQLVTMDGLHELISQGILLDYRAKTVDKSSSKTYSLQIGINSDSSSQISFELSGIDISALDGLVLEEANALSIIDEVLKSINAEQTKLGALENRLESALEQIGVAYDNLVSTQSTIRDADIAEESSAYIRNQILQQAAATLMSTANQTPAIALQLL